MNLVVESVSRDRLLGPTEADDVDGDMEVYEVDVQPQPRQGVPKTMRELAELHAQQQGEGTPQPRKEQQEGDLIIAESEGRVLEKGTSREAPGRRRRPGTRMTRTSKKRARRRDESEDASGVDGEESTPSKRRQLEAPVTPAPTLASTPNSNPGSGRVLRPRPQKSEARVREERAMEEAYRRAVSG